MPRPPKHGLGAAGRMARFMRYLADHDGSATSRDMRGGIASYKGSTGHRMWRRDLAELRSRGLVAQRDPGRPQSETITLIRLAKPKDLFLTRAEHQALLRARELLGRTAEPVSPLPADAPQELRRLFQLARYLEERSGRPLPYRQVTDEMGISETQLTELLRQVVEEDVDVEEAPMIHRALEWIDYMPPDSDDPEGFVRFVEGAQAAGEAADSTLDLDRGTAQLGCFAYNREETLETLALISAAQSLPDLPDEVQRDLHPARFKLRQWLRLLEGA